MGLVPRTRHYPYVAPLKVPEMSAPIVEVPTIPPVPHVPEVPTVPHPAETTIPVLQGVELHHPFGNTITVTH